MTNQKRIVVRTMIKRCDVSNEYQVKAFDQGGERFPEADYFTDDRRDAEQTARAMVQQCHSSNA